jgi:hypothetical protein
MKIYLKIDILLLTEIFENFIEISKKRYRIDPCWYYTLPGYSWDSAFYFTKQKVELFNNVNMIEFFLNNAIRGGISTVCRKKHLIANNEYIKETYNENMKKNYIMYLDVTNLYGYSMTQLLPSGNFRFYNDDEIEIIYNNINLLWENDSKKGYILEVDIDYPEYLFEKHIDLPFAPEHIDKKLSPNFNNKYNYKIHYIHLKLILEHGLILKKIHTIIEFDQSNW